MYTMTSAMRTIGCVDAATEILGDKWTPRLLRAFANQSEVRFCQLQELTSGINPRTLSSRLATLESHEIIRKVTSDQSSRCTYALTKKGVDLLPILQRMEQWSTTYS